MFYVTFLSWMKQYELVIPLGIYEQSLNQTCMDGDSGNTCMDGDSGNTNTTYDPYAEVTICFLHV